MENELVKHAESVIGIFKKDHPEYEISCYQSRPEVIYLKMSKPNSRIALTLGEAFDQRKYAGREKIFKKILKMSLEEMKKKIEFREAEEEKKEDGGETESEG